MSAPIPTNQLDDRIHNFLARKEHVLDMPPKAGDRADSVWFKGVKTLKI